MDLFDQGSIAGKFSVNDDLHILHAAPIVNLEEGKILLRFTFGANPTTEIHRSPRFACLEYLSHPSTSHDSIPWKDAMIDWTEKPPLKP
jgi:hypothetical protein